MSGFNLDIPNKISEFETIMKEFMLRRVIYRLLFRGNGLEFDGYRNFGPDEDAFNIDWKASRRAGRLLAKQYVEERDLKIMIAIDVSDNMIFGSNAKLKCEYAAELSACLAHLILISGDKLGFIFFNNDIIKVVLPASGMRQFEIFVHEVSNTKVYGGFSDFKKLVDFLIGGIDNSISTLIIISDFLKFNGVDLKKISFISEKCETMAFMIRDSLDDTLPNIQKEFILKDPRTGEKILINPKIARKSYERFAQEQKNKTKQIFLNSGIDLLEIKTGSDFVPTLAEFLRRRATSNKHSGGAI